MEIITKHFIPKKFDAITILFVTLLHPDHAKDEGLRVHEAVHRKQFWRNPLMPILYLCSKKYRQKYEVEAFKAQLKYSPHALRSFSRNLAFKYGLRLTFTEAYDLLK